MDFDFNQEQYMFQETLRGVLETVRSMETLRSGADASGLWQALAETGVFAMVVPEDAGGMGLGFTDLALVFEEFGRYLVPAEVSVAIQATALLARHGQGAQRSLLSQLATGAARLTMALAEAGSTTPDHIGLTAVRDGSGWRVSGEKLLVPGDDTVGGLVISLQLEGLGPRLVLVERGRPGLVLTPAETLDLSGKWCGLKLDGLRIEEADLLGQAEAVVEAFDVACALSSLVMTGIASRMLDEAVTYIGQRRQFDRFIGSFQAIKHRAADMAVALDASRSAAYFAAWAVDEAAADERARSVSMAKSWCGEQARFVVNQSLQLHGGIGFTWELGLHLFLRRLKVEEALHGDGDWHRERVIAQAVRALGNAA